MPKRGLPSAYWANRLQAMSEEEKELAQNIQTARANLTRIFAIAEVLFRLRDIIKDGKFDLLAAGDTELGVFAKELTVPADAKHVEAVCTFFCEEAEKLAATLNSRCEEDGFEMRTDVHQDAIREFLLALEQQKLGRGGAWDDPGTYTIESLITSVYPTRKVNYTGPEPVQLLFKKFYRLVYHRLNGVYFSRATKEEIRKVPSPIAHIGPYLPWGLDAEPGQAAILPIHSPGIYIICEDKQAAGEVAQYLGSPLAVITLVAGEDRYDWKPVSL